MQARPGGWTIAGIADELGVSTRQLRRDLDVLLEAGIDVRFCAVDFAPGVRLGPPRGEP
jgi:predicted DNA-binding transcriptional regulator YafY